MIDLLITGISQALKKITTEPVPVRIDPLEQDDDPATALFFVSPLNVTTIDYLGERRLVRIHFDVRYHPADPEAENTVELAQGLMAMGEALRRITLPDGRTKKAQDLETRIVDGVVHALMGYDFVLTKVEASEVVRSLELEYKSKRGEGNAG